MIQPDQRPVPSNSDDQPEPRGFDRRTVIRGAGIVGVGVVGVATLAACGGGSDSAAPAPADNAVQDAIKTADIPVGSGKVFASTKVVVTQPTAGEFKAFSAVCTHKGCTVSKVVDGTIDCACHGSKFNMTTGAVVDGPATSPLPSKTVTVKAGSLTIA